MKGRILTKVLLNKFKEHLILEERSNATIEKYCRDASAFADYTDGGVITKELTIAYKNKLKDLFAKPNLRYVLFLSCFHWKSIDFFELLCYTE